jgi:hypothetical protein
MIKKYDDNFIRNFWSKVDIRGKNDCWLWTGAKQSKGYGSIGNGNGDTVSAHRVAFEISRGKEIPDGFCVMHQHDCRLCCNPNHLTLGTIADNNRDMVRKGRQAKGEKNGRSKLTGQDVLKMRKLFQNDQKTMVELAHEFGVHYNTVRNAVHGITWKNLSVAV